MSAGPGAGRAGSPLRSERGLSAFTAVFILFLAAVAVLLYYRRSIQKDIRTAQDAPASVPAVPSAPPVEVREAPIPLEPIPLKVEAPGLQPAGPAGRGGAPDRASELNEEALKEFASGNYARAQELLEEALRGSDEDNIRKNLAAVKIKLVDMKGAAALLAPFEGDPLMHPLLKSIYITLGNEASIRGDVVSAAENYEKAAAFDPDDKVLKNVIERLDKERSAELRMTSKDGRHFLVKYEGGENAAAGHLIGLLLEEAYIKVGSDLNFYPGDTITALLYSKERFRDITRSPAWSGGIYDGRIKLPAGGVTGKTAELERVIFHEYTHAVVHRLANGRAPVWLNEGIAMYEEGRRSGEYADYLGELARTGKIDLKPLEGSFMGLGAEQAQVAYLLSLSATEYMVREFGTFSVRKVLVDVGKGMTMEEAVQDALYIPYDDLERSWIRYLARR
ncbi:MAG: peptidase MA family metallohydrolase [Thermodesulfobacteriota bacterium]